MVAVGTLLYAYCDAVLDPVSLNCSNDEIIQRIVEECNYNDILITRSSDFFFHFNFYYSF